uniref:DNA-directed DNA polymerase n=1 Tax=Panagrolaimus davidi TaxID=227884 RepID=A0A914QTG8_9BILA
MDPFKESCTIAGACMKTYRSKYLPEKTLAIVPEFGYQKRNTCSTTSLKYFTWLEHTTKKKIQHGNSQEGEYKIGKYSVDAYIPDEKHVIEFYGCAFHGHPKCFKPDTVLPTKRTAAKEYERTMAREKEIRNLGYTIEACNFETEYPVGIPEIITTEYSKQDVHWTKPSDYDIKGLVKVFIIPPRGLIIPVVPYKIGDFLLFPLCRSCCKIHENDETSRKTLTCNHTEQERGFISTLTHMELDLALKKGYVVKKYFGAYKYNDWSTDLFKPYVKKFLRLKVEADGWPPNVKTEEDKQRFIREYKEKFDIDIERENVKKNNAFRFICKLKLNSLWGRFSLRNTLSKTLVSDDPLEVDRILSGDAYEVSSIDLLDENRVMIIYNEKKDFIVENDASNIIISLWTTSAARIKLYEIMDIIVNTPGCTLIYTDTDSVIFECPENFCPLETGNYLGELTDEVGPDEEIIEVIVGGNKQYALKKRNKITGEITYVLKLRGITLNAETSTLLHYEKFKDMDMEVELLDAASKVMSDHEQIVERLNGIKAYLPFQLHNHIITVRDYLTYYREKPFEIYVFPNKKTIDFKLINPSFLHQLGCNIQIGMEFVLKMSHTLTLNHYLSYGRVPDNQRHQRIGTTTFKCNYWMRLTHVPNWAWIDLRGMSCRTDFVRLVDPEICFTTNIERSALYHYYSKRGRTVVIPQFIVRDNNSGNLYLPQDVQICSNFM